MVEDGGREDVDVVVVMIAEGIVVVGVEDVDDVDDEEEDWEVVGVVDGVEEEVVDEDGDGAGTTTTVVDVDGLGVELEDGLVVTDGLTTIVVVELTMPGDIC